MMTFYNEDFSRHFLEVYTQVKEGTAALDTVEDMILFVYNTEPIYEEIEKRELMWKRLQAMERYMNKHDIYYDSKVE